MNLFIDKIPGAGECKDKEQNCTDIGYARIHHLREESQKDKEKAETGKADEDIKESRIHRVPVVPAPLNQYPHHHAAFPVPGDLPAGPCPNKRGIMILVHHDFL
jgi:hypothetical protein